jgi:hypothetical protein
VAADLDRFGAVSCESDFANGRFEEQRYFHQLLEALIVIHDQNP